MFGTLMVGSWVTIREGCPISYSVTGSGEANFFCGPGSDGFEFTIDAEALREFVTIGTAALADMDARFAGEQGDDRG